MKSLKLIFKLLLVSAIISITLYNICPSTRFSHQIVKKPAFIFGGPSHKILSVPVNDKYQTQGYLLNNKNEFELVQDSQVSYQKPLNIGVLYIATGRYISFWNDFYISCEKNFLPKHKKTYFLFTDFKELKVPDNVIKIYQEQLPWPYITLLRYHFFTNISYLLEKTDYVFFFNANIIFKDTITEDILPTKEQGITVTLHPGQYRNLETGNYTYERRIESEAYIPNGQGKYYIMGGFNGGRTKDFLKMSETIKEWTNTDLENKIIPVWHDESMLNKYIWRYMKNGKKPLVLLPNYLVPEQGFSSMDEMRPITKIMILDKNIRGGHNWFRTVTKN